VRKVAQPYRSWMKARMGLHGVSSAVINDARTSYASTLWQASCYRAPTIRFVWIDLERRCNDYHSRLRRRLTDIVMDAIPMVLDLYGCRRIL